MLKHCMLESRCADLFPFLFYYCVQRFKIDSYTIVIKQFEEFHTIQKLKDNNRLNNKNVFGGVNLYENHVYDTLGLPVNNYIP